MTLEEFKKTGRFFPREEFQKKNTITLHDECTDIIVYEGGYCIEVLKDGIFAYTMCDNNCVITNVKNKSLDMVEKIMWQRHADKFINNETEIKQE
jgi:hypothetical protein